MFLTATLSLNPGDRTEILGSNVDSLEHETFSASQILQRLVVTMRSVGITDASLLMRDDDVIFKDLYGEYDDLTEALRSFSRKTTKEAKRQFDTLRLVLEHESSLLYVVIDARVENAHGIGAAPVVIRLMGFLHAFCTEDEDSAEFQMLFDRVFESQVGYDEVCHAARAEFTQLVDAIKDASAGMAQDGIDVHDAMRVLLADPNPHAAIAFWPRQFDHSCVGQDDVRYCYLWQKKCLDHDIRLSDCELINSSGSVEYRHFPVGIQNSSPFAARSGVKSALGNPLRGFSVPEERLPTTAFSLIAPSMPDVWKTVAREIGAQFLKPGIADFGEVVLHLHDRQIILDHYCIQVGDDTKCYTRVEALAENPSGLQFVLFQERLRSTILKLVGMQDIEIGDPEFDRRFVIKGNDASAIAEFLSDRNLRRLIILQPHTHLSIDRTVTFTVGVELKDAELIVRLFELFFELLRRLDT